MHCESGKIENPDGACETRGGVKRRTLNHELTI
jgi:hypothetical protein